MLDVYLGSYVNWNFDTHTVCQSKTGESDVCSPNVFEGQTNTLFVNRGDGTFQIASDLLPSTQPAKSLGAVAAEFVAGNGTELYIANDLIPISCTRGELENGKRPHSPMVPLWTDVA